MSRPILPFPPSYGSSQQLFHLPPQPDPPPPPPSKPTHAKRGRITIVACLPCRKLKAKCDGKRPACSQCLRRDRQCQYNMTDEQRRLTFLRENVEHLEREKRELESLLLTLQRSAEDNAAEVMRILRTSNDLQAIARHAHTGRLLSILPGELVPRGSSSSGCEHDGSAILAQIGLECLLRLDLFLRYNPPAKRATFSAVWSAPGPHPDHCVRRTHGAGRDCSPATAW
ncbi:hypothetical protein B0J12DRAFT_641150 [Macrophomina phaseolina]|uniref:Zn(2)-C6 fungal-type domain-containing protein n=1 Tax=Macrophomina phaseolina TaxID=35725 RepID=A0ABQ8GX23_9PEZI|nr:hypothetical protein B0J12DRAFT_641150 [Macrophomina phaseolina]